MDLLQWWRTQGLTRSQDRWPTPVHRTCWPGSASVSLAVWRNLGIKDDTRRFGGQSHCKLRGHRKYWHSTHEVLQTSHSHHRCGHRHCYLFCQQEIYSRGWIFGDIIEEHLHSSRFSEHIRSIVGIRSSFIWVVQDLSSDWEVIGGFRIKDVFTI